MNAPIQPLLQNENFSPFWEIRVLLIESNISTVRLVEKVLETSPVRCFLRRIDNTHDLAFELKYNKPHVLLSGRSMNGFDAGQVLDLASLYTPGVPVLVLAPDFNPALCAELVQKGAYDILYHSEIKRLPLELGFLYQQLKENDKVAS